MNRLNEIEHDPLRYLWSHIWGMSWKRVFRYVATIVCFCAVWRVLEVHINPVLIAWTMKWIVPLDSTIVVYAMHILLFIGLVYAIYCLVKKNAHLLYSGWVFWTLLTIVYSYYRFCPTSPFEFWKTGNWAWLDMIYIIDGGYILFALIYGIRVLVCEIKEAMKLSQLLRDDAINDSMEDMFEYKRITGDLKWMLDSVDISEKAFSVGIAGEWGSGKSSLLNLFVRQQEEEGQIVVRFNPRSAKQADMIQEEFFAVFTDEIGKYSYNARHVIGKYAYALNLHSSTQWIYAIFDLFENWTSASEKERINDLIRATGKRVYVIIEDLDRLTGPEITEVLKLIDANGNFCHTIFLTAYDKSYVNSVLRKQIGYEGAVADFTDKYFQYEFPLFRQTNQPMQRFFDLHLKTWAQTVWTADQYQVQLIEKEWTIVRRLLLSHIENMRQAKRYINLFRSAYRWHKDYVDFGDCAIVTMIRFLDPKIYYDLYAGRFLRHPGGLALDEKEWELAEHYNEMVGVKMQGLAEYLFNNTSGYRQFEPKYNRICRVESFENYFHEKIQGKIYADNMDLLMQANDLQDALELFDRYSKNIGWAESITEYLCMHDEEWIETEVRMERYMEILIYTHAKTGGLEIGRQMINMFLTSSYRRLKNHIGEGPYRACIRQATEVMLPIVPYAIGEFFKDRLRARYSRADKMDRELVESLEWYHKILKKAQEAYDNTYGSPEWKAQQSIELGVAVKDEDIPYAKARAGQLMKMMNEHPDEYAKGLIQVEASDILRTHSFVKLTPYDGLRVAVSDKELKEWAEKVQNADLQFLIVYLLNHKNVSGYPNAPLDAAYEEVDGQYEKMASILKKNTEEKIYALS